MRRDRGYRRAARTAAGESSVIVATVELPLLEGMQGVHLDVTQRCLKLRFDACYAPLALALPAAVRHESTAAKFNKKARCLTVSMVPAATVGVEVI